MNSCEKLIELMRNEGSKNHPPIIELGEMLSSTTCRIGENELELEDLYIAEHLTDHERIMDMDGGEKVEAETTTQDNHSHKLQYLKTQDTKIRFHTTLKRGDLVAVYRISEEKYLIFAKVVNGDVSV